MSKIDDSKYDLLIDQYSRQKWVFDIINQIRSGKQINILDVGGYKGKTSEFQINDIVTVCDLFDVEEPGYVKGDGRKLPFANNQFDIVVTFDTLEHVPRKDRKVFISELRRVAKKAVIVAAPFDNEKGDILRAEKALNQFHIDLYGSEHRWLKEHIDYKTPKQSEFEKIATDLKQSFVGLASNDLSIWQFVQSLYFMIDLDDDLRGRVDDVNRFYNRNLRLLDVQKDVSYRKIYVLSEDKHIINTTQKFIDQLEQSSTSKKYDFMAFGISTLGKKYRDLELHNKYLEGELIKFKKEKDDYINSSSTFLKRVFKKFKH